MISENKFGTKHLFKVSRSKYQREIENKCIEEFKDVLNGQACIEYLLNYGIILEGQHYNLQDLDEDSYIWISNIIAKADGKIAALKEKTEAKAYPQNNEKKEERKNVSDTNTSITVKTDSGGQSNLSQTLPLSQGQGNPKCGTEDIQEQILQLTKQLAEQSEQICQLENRSNDQKEQTKMINTVVLHTLGIPMGGLVGYFIGLDTVGIIASSMVLPSAAVGYAISTISAATYYYFDSVYAYVGAGYLLTLSTTYAYDPKIGTKVLGAGSVFIGVPLTVITTKIVCTELLWQGYYMARTIVVDGISTTANKVEWVWKNYPTGLVGSICGLAYAPAALYLPKAAALAAPWAKAFGKPASLKAQLAFGLGHTAAFGIAGGVIGNYWDNITDGLWYCTKVGAYAIKTVVVKDYDIIRSFVEQPIQNLGQASYGDGFTHVHVFQEHPWTSAVTTLALLGGGIGLHMFGWGLSLSIFPPLILLRGVDIVNPTTSLAIGMVAEAGAFAGRYFKEHQYTQGIKAMGIGAIVGVSAEVIGDIIGEGIKCALEGCLGES